MWSKTKKYLENLLCESLKGRVEFHCSNYRMHDGIGRIYITVDKKEIYNMCTLKRDYYREPIQGFFSQVEFLKVAFEYLNSPIEESLLLDNPLNKILVVLDRRIGKRTLEKMKSSIENEEDIVKYLFKLRCGNEGVLLNDFNFVD